MSIIQVENVWLYSQLAHLKTHSREKSNNVDFPGGKCLAKLSAGTQPEFQCSGAQVKFTLKKIVWLFRLLFWWFPWWYVRVNMSPEYLKIFIFRFFKDFRPFFFLCQLTGMFPYKLQWNLPFSWYSCSIFSLFSWYFIKFSGILPFPGISHHGCHKLFGCSNETVTLVEKWDMNLAEKKTSQDFQILPYVTSSWQKTPNF